MSSDQKHLRSDARLFEFSCDGRYLVLVPEGLHDSPRRSPADDYCPQWNCLADDTPTVNGMEYLRYWDCCGASTVAIENKIEQALDLVKNHLMFAVREEVRLLNEEIRDLLSKNEQLENENRILRSSASPETLSRLHRILSHLNDRNAFAT